MTKTLLRIIVLLLTAPMTLWSCDAELPDSPYDPSDSTAIWKVSIMGDSYSTYAGMQSICEQVYAVLRGR